MAKRAKDKITDEDRELLGSLGVDSTPTQKQERTPKEQRIIAGFEEIERFVEEQGRAPQHGEGKDIFERLYAVRLDKIRESEECREALEGLDSQGLLEGSEDSPEKQLTGDEDDEALLAALGADEEPGSDLTELKHVRSREEIRVAEEIAQRAKCEDFAVFKPLFEQLQGDLDSGARKTLKYKNNGEINLGDFFIVEGQKAYVAEKGEQFINDYDRPDHRLRVIFDNGTENELLLRSLQRALNRDKVSRRVTQADMGPLFADEKDDGDLTSGFIYVLRSLSDDPFIQSNRTVIHKIGVTGGEVKKRIANAAKEPTFLLAEVEVVTVYELVGINRKGLESLLHRFFSPAKLEVELPDRFGQAVEPNEWFLVPFPVIERAVELLREGTIDDYRYDPEQAEIVEREG